MLLVLIWVVCDSQKLTGENMKLDIPDSIIKQYAKENNISYENLKSDLLFFFDILDDKEVFKQFINKILNNWQS